MNGAPSPVIRFCKEAIHNAPSGAVAGIAGIEPAKRESKARVLPLHYIPLSRSVRFIVRAFFKVTAAILLFMRFAARTV